MNQKIGTVSKIPEYEALSSAGKAMVQLLAVTVGDCYIEIVMCCLNDLGYVDNRGRRFTVTGIKSLEEELQAKGLLMKTRYGLTCPESVRRLAFHETLKEDTFPAIVKVLQKHLPLPTQPPNDYHHLEYRRLLADFQMTLFYHGSLEIVHDLVFRQAHGLFADDYYENNPFLTVLNRPFSADIVEKIKPAIRLDILADVLAAAEICLEPAEDIVAYIKDKYADEIVSHSAGLQLLQHYLLKGDTSSCRLLLDKWKESSPTQPHSWTGWLECIGGNYEEALSHFNASIQLIKKRSGKRKVFLQNTTGIFCLLTLLQSGETGALKEALEYIAIAEKGRFPLAPLMATMAPVFHDRLGQTGPEPFVGNLRYLFKNPLHILFFQLFLFWKDGKKAAIDIPLLKKTRDKALKNGYPWLAAELSSLLAALGEDEKTNSEMAEKLHASCKTRSCVGLVRLQPQWEKTLTALLHINTPNKDEKTGAAAAQRLIWLFSYDETYGYCHITPRLQKMTAQGKWTKGRPMALKTLYHDHHAMPGLTERDRQVCRAIKEEYYRTGWRYGKTEYVLDPELALPALVGHPLLFLEDAPGVNVELMLTEPELHIREEKGKLKLSVTPFFVSGIGNILVQKDTPTRFRVIRFKPEHQQVIDLLGQGLTIPKAGEKLARQVVDTLSGVITVHSDLEAAGRATTVPADCRPHAHILPYKEGVSLEFLVKPVSAGGSSFTPGKGSKSVMAMMDGKTVQTVRDLAEEKQRLAGVIEACPTLKRLEEIDNRWQADDPEDSLELLLELKECGDDVVLEWPQGEKLKVRRQVPARNFSLRIGKDRDWFKATGSLEIDDTLTLDLRQLLEKIDRSTGRFIPLDDGTFLAITKSLRRRLEELQAFSESHGQGVRFAPSAALALDDLIKEVPRLHSDKAWKEHCKNMAETVTPPVPSTLQARLRDYQATGFSWLARLSSWRVGACLADDMGLGKTVQALAAILLRASLGPTLVVAPLSVTSNWQEEAGRFAPTLNVIIFGPGDRRQVIADLQPFDLVIVSYGLLPLEAELLGSVEWQTVILDEAQAIKNMQTKRSKAAMGLRSECKIITTGTPLENHLGELWTLFNFLNPGLLGSFKKFNEKFAIPIERDQDKEARNRLRKLIRPFILRRLKSDVLQELPPKTEITLEVRMSPEEQVLYEAMRQKALETIEAHKEEEAGQQHLRILAEIMKLRRLCCNPSLVMPDAGIASSKLRVFVDTLRELLDNNHKALIFSQFIDHLTIIRNYLDDQKISYQYLDGSTPIAQRKERVNSFQNGAGDVFLISLKAGGAGLNLTAADFVIHMDPWWNPAVEDQASDRAHRIGQDRPVTVYRLVMKDTIEQQIVELHKQKRDLADSLLEGTDVAGKISAAELLALLHEEKATTD
ncbi:MAG: hypothetical protein VR65_00530 [Desulfobulbaceae bacterium BRH_c16a]|nr:MAG: hypothetical protein VR65_00530 [Desulfobulbaceae bacterium BRH_c16a]